MAVASLFEDLLDQYKIEQYIAKKRYTELYQAYDVDDDSQVRLEILRAEFAEDGSFTGRFVNRARAMAQVRHSNIAQVLHIGTATGGAPYVAQAAVDGYPLSHRLEQLAQRNTPANPIYALKLIRQLGDALVLAERLELFHYDLQPENVLLRNVTLPTDDAVVLIDLFIPSERHARANDMDADAAFLDYLSPEQRAGKEVTAASHIYSLGAMLYSILGGQAPKKPVTRGDIVFGRLFGRATALERERTDLTPSTYDLVERCLRKDPRGRYASIEAFITALDGALAAEEARLGSTGRAMTVDRRPAAWLMPLLIVALFLAVGAVATRGLLNRDRSGDLSPGQFVATTSSGVAAEAGGPTESLPTKTPLATDQPVVVAIAPSNTSIPAGVGETVTPSVENATATEEPSPSATPTEEPTATPPATSVEQPRVRVMFNLVNLRRGPGVTYPLMGNIAGGEMLEVLAWNDDEANPWYLVLTDDQRIGWIAATVVQADMAEALAAIPVAATLPPTPVPTTTSTPTPTFTVVVTISSTIDSGDPGSGGATRPPVEPTAQPTEPPADPTRTPPSFTPSP